MCHPLSADAMQHSDRSYPDVYKRQLHILAMAFMFCDHLWATLAGDAWWLTGIGRLAFPMFAFFLVEGFLDVYKRQGSDDLPG